MKIIIPGEMPSMNEIIAEAKKGKRGYQPYNDMKREHTNNVKWVAQKLPKMDRVFLDITWYAKNKKKDPDNIAAAVKFIWDGLVQAEVIPNDGWSENCGWSNKFKIDKDNPRVEVVIKEVKNELF